MSSSKLVVAVAGATGRLGVHVVKALLAPDVKDSIGEVRALTRSDSNKTSQELNTLGARVLVVDPLDGAAVTKALRGVDVVINVLPSAPDDQAPVFKAKEVLWDAVRNSGVRVYIPSEFGLDHRKIDITLPEWELKKVHASKVRKEGGDKVKVIQVFAPGFLDFVFGPWLGFNTQGKKYEIIGNPSQPVSPTSLPDLGRATTRLAILAAADTASVPDIVRIAGTEVSAEGLAKLVAKHGGPEDVEVKQVMTSEEGKAQAKDILFALRYLLGSGQGTYFGSENDNELVNPGQKYWTWTTADDYVKSVGGRLHFR